MESNLNPTKKVAISSDCPSLSPTSSKDEEGFASFKVAIMNENVDTKTFSGDYYSNYTRNRHEVMKQFITDLMHLAGSNNFSFTSVNDIDLETNQMQVSNDPLIFKKKICKQLQDFLYNLFKWDDGNFLFTDNNLTVFINFTKQLMNNGWDSFRLLGTIMGMKIISAVLYISKGSLPPSIEMSQKFSAVWGSLYSSVIRHALRDYSFLVSVNILKEFHYWSIHYVDILKMNNIRNYIKDAIVNENLFIKMKGYEILISLATNHSQDDDFLNIFQFAKTQLLDCLDQIDVYKETAIAILYYLSRIKDKLITDSKEIELWYKAMSDTSSTVCTYAAKYLYETHLQGRDIGTMLRTLVQFIRKVNSVDVVADSFSWFFIKNNITKEWKKLIKDSKNADDASLLYAILKKIVLNEPPQIQPNACERLNKFDRQKFATQFTLNFINDWLELMDHQIQDMTALQKLIEIVPFFDKKSVSSQVLLQIWYKLSNVFLKYSNINLISTSCLMMDYLETSCTFESSDYILLEQKKNKIIKMTAQELLDHLKFPLVPISLFQEDIQRILSVFKYFLFDDETVWLLFIELLKNVYFMDNLKKSPELIMLLMTCMFEMFFRRLEDLHFLENQLNKHVNNSRQYRIIMDELNDKEINIQPRIYELELHFTFILDSSLSYEIKNKCFFYFSKLFRSCGPHVCNNDSPLFLLFLNFEEDFPTKLAYVAQKGLLKNSHDGDNSCCEVLKNFLSLLSDNLIEPKHVGGLILHLGKNALHDLMIITSIESMLAKSYSNIIETANTIFTILLELSVKANIKRGQEILSLMFSNSRNNDEENVLYLVHDLVIKECIKRENTIFILLIIPSVKLLTTDHKTLLYKVLDTIKITNFAGKEVQLYISKLQESIN